MTEFAIILLLAFGAMWLMTAKTRRQQKEAANFRATLEPDQEVMTGSGMFGTIVDVDGEIITLETSPGVTSRWLRPAIAKLVEPPVEDDDDLDESEHDASTGLLEDNPPHVPDDLSGLTRPEDDERR